MVRLTPKSFLVAAVLVATIPSAASAQLAVKASGAKTVTLSDRVGKNQFLWSSDAPLEKIKGSAEGVTGSFTIDPKNLSAIKGTISASVGSMKSGNNTRDEHLKGTAWLDAAKHPQITFAIASVSNVKVNGNTATATANGTFTLHGVTKQLSIPIKITYLDASDKTRQRAPGDLVMVSASFTIALADFKVAGTKGIVGSKVGETIEVTAQLFGSTQ